MPGMWTEHAKVAAEKAYGEANYKWLAFFRAIPYALAVVAFAGFGVAVVALVRVASSAATGAVRGASWWQLGGAVVVAIVVARVVSRVRRRRARRHFARGARH